MADTTYRPIENGFRTQLSQDLAADAAELTIYCVAVPTATIPSGKFLAVVLSAGTVNQEIVKVESIDTINNTMTIASGGRGQNLGNAYSGVVIEHNVGATVTISDDYITLDDYGDCIDSKVDVSGDTMTGQLNFSGTTHAGVKMISLTTAQRLALTAANGMIVYDSDLGMNMQYTSGSWKSIDTGTATPNGSTTVNGTWQGATVAQQGTATATGSTGASLLVQNQFLIKTSSGAGDENKIPVLNSSGQFASGFIPSSDFLLKSTVDAKGDLYAATAADTVTRLPVGTVNNMSLVVDSAQTTGLKYALKSQNISTVTADVSVNNTTTETTLFTVSIPANYLGTTNSIDLKIWFTNLGFRAANDGLTIRLKYGGSTALATGFANVNATAVSALGGLMQMNLAAQGSTASQVAAGVCFGAVSTGENNGAGVTMNKSYGSAIGSPIGVDSTSAQDLVVTAQWSAANASNTFTMSMANITLNA